MMKSLSGIPGILCPACHNGRPKRLGSLTGKNGIIRLSFPGDLYECKRCGLFFRRPYLSQQDLVHQYSELPAGLWERKESPDFMLAVQTIMTDLPSGKILDVGCYRGDFLDMLPERYQKFGVEPSKTAQAVSRERGIEIVGSSIEEIEDRRTTFHAITLLDLIEHLPHPLESLRKVRDLLAPGGIIILSTGNTSALPWRLMRLDYWYYFSEHVSFFNRKWFEWAARELTLRVARSRKFSHFRGPLSDRVRQLARCFLFHVMRRCENTPLLREPLIRLYPFTKVGKWSGPPTANLWPDHLLVVLKSPQ